MCGIQKCERQEFLFILGLRGIEHVHSVKPPWEDGREKEKKNVLSKKFAHISSAHLRRNTCRLRWTHERTTWRTPPRLRAASLWLVKWVQIFFFRCRPLSSPSRRTSSLVWSTSTCSARRGPCTASSTTPCPTSTFPISNLARRLTTRSTATSLCVGKKKKKKHTRFSNTSTPRLALILLPPFVLLTCVQFLKTDSGIWENDYNLFCGIYPLMG